jgi:hypothetical protein
MNPPRIEVQARFRSSHPMNGLSTYMIEKIWSGLIAKGLTTLDDLTERYKHVLPDEIDNINYQKFKPQYQIITMHRNNPTTTVFIPAIRHKRGKSSRVTEFFTPLTITGHFEYKVLPDLSFVWEGGRYKYGEYDHDFCIKSGIEPRDFGPWFNSPRTGHILSWLPQDNSSQQTK